MGEISEALRRARLDRAARPATSPPATSVARPVGDAPPPPGRGPGAEATPPEKPARVAAIAAGTTDSWPARVVALDGLGAPAAAAQHLALRVRRALEERRARSLAVVSCERAEGKTTVACNLALALASLSRGRSVALVDLDLREPSLAHVLGLSPEHGIDDVLRGDVPLPAACVQISKPTLDVYAARKPEHAAHELLVGSGFSALVAELEQRYALTVLDTPPTLLVPDAPVIVEQAGAALAVSRAGRTRRRAFERMVEMLPRAKLVGSVLNDGTPLGPEAHYGYYGSSGKPD